MDIDNISASIVIELDYLLRQKHGSMILDWNYEDAKAKVVEVLESRLTPHTADAACAQADEDTGDNRGAADV